MKKPPPSYDPKLHAYVEATFEPDDMKRICMALFEVLTAERDKGIDMLTLTAAASYAAGVFYGNAHIVIDPADTLDGTAMEPFMRGYTATREMMLQVEADGAIKQ